MMLVSLDNVHLPFSTNQTRSQLLSPIMSIFELNTAQNHGDWQYNLIPCSLGIEADGNQQSSSLDDVASKLKSTLQSKGVWHEIEFEKDTNSKALYSRLGEFLYGLENLRKKAQGDREAQEEEAVLAINPEEA